MNVKKVDVVRDAKKILGRSEKLKNDQIVDESLKIVNIRMHEKHNKGRVVQYIYICTGGRLKSNLSRNAK